MPASNNLLKINIRHVDETGQRCRFCLTLEMIRGTFVNALKIYLHNITPLKMSWHAILTNLWSTLTLTKTAIWNVSQIESPQHSLLVKE